MSFFVADSAAPPPAAAGAPSAVSASPTRPADGAPNCSAADLRLDGPRNQTPPATGVAGGALSSRRVRAFALSGAQARVAPPAVAVGDARVSKPDPPATAQPAPGSGGPGQAPASASHGDEVGGASHATRAPRSVRPPQSFEPFAAADGASPSTTPSDAPASRPGWGSGRDVPPSFDTHVDRVLNVGGFGPPVDPLGPRLVQPAPLVDPALRDGWYDERTGLISGGYPPVLAANDIEAGLTDTAHVWIAVRRRGVDRHALGAHSDLEGNTFTICSRSTCAGELLAADDPWIVAHTQPCPRCWPGGA